MLNSRLSAVESASKHLFNETTEVNADRGIHIYNKNVLNTNKMRDYLPKETFDRLRCTIDTGGKIPRELAEYIAQAMKTWALENGATHYTHWFQPL
ncbi:MAG: glutamine synthetase III, partial [Sphingobacterium sp.]